MAGLSTASAPTKPLLVESDSALSRAPVRWRELAAAVTLVALCDLTIYRGQGYAGIAALLFAAPLLLVVGAPRPRLRPAVWIVGAMLVVLVAKLVWCGSSLLACAGFVLLLAFAMSLAGQTPHVLESVVFGSLAVAGGFQGLSHYGRNLTRESAVGRLPWIELLLPAGALVLFGSIFILANPDLVTSVSSSAEAFLRRVADWLSQFSVLEVLFWAVVAWIAVGLMRPAAFRTAHAAAEVVNAQVQAAPAALYSAFRNTLLTVIVLFAGYLVFEFRTLWFREFPRGFHYSGYAHEGAAWLTFALALATVVLSLVFRGSILADPRLPRLRRLAWIWSALNLIMALAVYNRLFIYIGFNGLTRMRMIGLLGITTVVVGFLWVVWKIAHSRDFVWLVRRQLWTLAAAVYLFAVMPVDAIVCRYNVRRILSGDPAPSVQISVHPISSEGILLLRPLVECRDATIREGVRAMLAERLDEAELLARTRDRLGWTTWQLADQRMLAELRREQSRWSSMSDLAARHEARQKFDAYAYQWY